MNHKSNGTNKASSKNGVRSLQQLMGGLSHCAGEYMGSLANPFEGPEGACIPDFPALMTGKQRVWAKGTFATSTDPAAGGFGYILCDPLRATTNDLYSVITNTPTSVGSLCDMTTGTQYTTNAQYGAASFGASGIQARIVSSGLRVRYVGNELYRGGRMIALAHPAHTTLDTYSEPTILAYKEGISLPVVREWTNLVYRPVEQSDYDFTYTFPVLAAGVQAFHMGLCVKSPDPSGANPMQFEFEFYTNIEYQGQNIVNKTMSHVDAAGHGAVNAIANASGAIVSAHQQPITMVMNAAVAAASRYLTANTSNSSAPPAKIEPEKASSWFSDVLKVGAQILPSLLAIL